MRIIPQSKNLTDADKKIFMEYLKEKTERFRPIIESHYPDADTVIVNCRIQRHERHNVYEVKFDIKTPKGGAFETKVVKHNINEAMDKATDKLEQQIIKHFKKLTRA